jgi:hypothetical protein
MHDRYKKRHRAPLAADRLRRQIATEAARRLLARSGSVGGDEPRPEPTGADLYTAKLQAVAVLGRRVRPADLPSDDEVRAQMAALARNPVEGDSPEPAESPERLGERLDRFTVYRLRLTPLHDVKLDPRSHPEGDALYHSLQVYSLAREARPYDEEFLLAALLHEVGRAIDPSDPVAPGLESLAGTITGRTAWLIEHLPDLDARPGRALSPKTRRALEASEFFDDLALLHELDAAGRVPGTPVGTVEEAIAYLKGLEEEAYLEQDQDPDGA